MSLRVLPCTVDSRGWRRAPICQSFQLFFQKLGKNQLSVWKYGNDFSLFQVVSISPFHHSSNIYNYLDTFGKDGKEKEPS